jgi:hypothetical protein
LETLGVHKINLEANFTLEHLTQFINIWILHQSVSLVDDVDDSIHWKLTINGQYSAASAYKLLIFWARAIEHEQQYLEGLDTVR